MGTEVLIIGGGPAGLATAIAAAQHGFRVAVAEPQAGAIDKCCGEGLLPAAVGALARLGIPARELLSHGVPLRGIRFHHDGLPSAGAAFSVPGVGLRRTALHCLLRKRARSLDVHFLEHSARLVGDAGHQQVRVNGKLEQPRWILACDGTQSLLRQDAGLDHPKLVSRRFAVRRHFKVPPGAAGQHAMVEVHWAPGAQAYVTPVDEETVGVAIVTGEKLQSFGEMLVRFPLLAETLERKEPLSEPRGAVSLHQSFPRVTSGRLALVGDASGGVDAIAGDGLALAFEQALAVSEAITAGDLALYERAHARLLLRARTMSRALLCMGSYPWVTRGSLLLLAGVPDLFRLLLCLHTGRQSPVRDRWKEEEPWQAAPISERSAT